jgi:hypothetical protein
MGAIERRGGDGGGPVIIAEHMAPVSAARHVIGTCRSIPAMPIDRAIINTSPLECSATNLPRALSLDDAMPTYDAISAAEVGLYKALDRPLDRSVARALIVVMLGALGKKPGDDAALYLWGLTEATGDDVLSDDARLSIAPCALAGAVLKIIREQKFLPAPAELRAACGQVSAMLSDMLREVAHYSAVRNAVDDILISHGPKERWPSLDDGWLRNAD